MPALEALLPVTIRKRMHAKQSFEDRGSQAEPGNQDTMMILKFLNA
jgi:hypothetical protein